MNPIRTLREAVTTPFSAIFVVAICALINVMTTPGHWWVQWVALGMGIAVVCAWARALKLLVAGGLLLIVGNWAYRRWGEEGRQRVQQWLGTPGTGAPSR